MEEPVTPGQYSAVYKDLYDIHRVLSDAKKLVSKKQIMQLCDIKKMDVGAIELKESLAKPKAPPVYDDRAKANEVEKLKKFVKEKAMRAQIIKKKADTRITKQEFVDKLLIKELKYANGPGRATEVLT